MFNILFVERGITFKRRDGERTPGKRSVDGSGILHIRFDNGARLCQQPGITAISREYREDIGA